MKMKTVDEKAFLYFKSICQRIMKKRAENKQRQDDFLQLMIEAREGRLAPCGESGDDPGTSFCDDGMEPKSNGAPNSKVLTEDEALAQCVLFFVGGQETTASTVAFAAHLLATHPEAQDRLRREVDDCISTHGEEPSMDVVSKLKYLQCVVSETLRLYPSAPRLERSALEDYVLGETGIKLPKGCTVIVPVYALHRDPEYFPEPDAFKPERFSDENIGSIRPYTYLPFGAGPRNCIGMRLGLHAVKVALLHSIHKVQFVRTEKTQVPLNMKIGFGAVTAEDMTLPRDTFRIIVRPRDGLNVAKSTPVQVEQALAMAAALAPEDLTEDSICPNPWKKVLRADSRAPQRPPQQPHPLQGTTQQPPLLQWAPYIRPHRTDVGRPSTRETTPAAATGRLIYQTGNMVFIARA
ncbi:cytochrome P450 3A19-like [Dermacentor andersoni]|uniref:cytochrome P450 3A19-like n=1 Tax=Dermacentor andersoni TaxID=34620 RepID=UPI003B3A205B